MTARRKRRRGRGALAMIAMLLIGSGLLRAGLGAGAALARDEENAGLPEAAQTVQDACESQGEIAPLLAALNEREGRVAAQEARMRDRMRALEIAEQEVSRKTNDLLAAEEALRATIALADNAAEDDIMRLVSVYQAMKPKNAAALFETMDPEFAAGFFGRMDPQAAAAIMAGLTPEMAYTVSVVLAGRNASVPKQ